MYSLPEAIRFYVFSFFLNMMVYACIREPTVERGQEMGGGEDGD